MKPRKGFSTVTGNKNPGWARRLKWSGDEEIRRWGDISKFGMPNVDCGMKKPIQGLCDMKPKTHLPWRPNGSWQIFRDH
jgi:hypothetical protein